jgi:hypothetical protein
MRYSGMSRRIAGISGEMCVLCVWIYDGWMDRVEELGVRCRSCFSLDGIWYGLGIWDKTAYGGYIYRDRYILGLAEVGRRIVGIIAIYPGSYCH